ncbi:MAG: TRAP transporter small permease [Sedimenticolaceae bacterium]
MSYTPTGPISRFINHLEENFIALILAAMTGLTFANVIARYVFNDNILWALEATVYLFAWLVLFGMSYAVKTSAHLGVDVVVNRQSPGVKKALGLLSVAACLLFAGLLLTGSIEYWWRFFSKMSFLESEDVPFPVIIQSLVGLVENGEAKYENIPRFIPYFILPFGFALMALRFLEVGWLIWTDRKDMVIASHEAEDMMDEMTDSENKG